MMFQFETLADFLLMNGHGVYVWSSYVLTAIALSVLGWLPYRKKQALIIQLKRHQRIDIDSDRE
jgi:heme exporter protein D